jgi:hypothetical protein
MDSLPAIYNPDVPYTFAAVYQKAQYDAAGRVWDTIQATRNITSLRER